MIDTDKLIILCPSCHKNPSTRHPVYGIMHCEECKKKTSHLSGRAVPVSRLHRIQENQDHGGKDIIQPFVNDKINPDFAKAYPKRAEQNFTKKELTSL